jgi:hypothetical protein
MDCDRGFGRMVSDSFAGIAPSGVACKAPMISVADAS